MDLVRSFYLHLTRRNKIIFDQLNQYAKIAKRLYNMLNYDMRRWYEVYEETLSYFDLIHLFQHRPIWKLMKTEMTDITLKMFYGNFQGWFEAMKSFRRDPSKFKQFPQMPNFLPKFIDRYHFAVRRVTLREKSLIITKDFSIPVPDNQILPELKKTVEYKTGKKTYVKQVRFYPRGKRHYKIEMVYEIEDKLPLLEGYAAGIDLNVDNLAFMSNNGQCSPLLFNLKPLKSYNRNWNKQRANITSKLKKVNDQHNSNYLNSLNFNRDQYFNNFIHQLTTTIITICRQYHITHLIMGRNKDWKQEVNMGRYQNQKFVQIPFDKIRSQLKYKCELEGLQYEETEESYTSKTDHLCYEPLGIYGENDLHPHLGQRGTTQNHDRHFFYSSIGKIIHADINGSIGIMRKILGDNCISDCLNNPRLYNPQKINFRSGSFDPLV